MAIADSVKKLKTKCSGFTAKEKSNHRVVNIMLTALFALIFLLTLFGGVNVNIGSTVKGDDEGVVVRQSFFKIIRAGFGSVMSTAKAEEYVKRVNKELRDEYGVLEHLLVNEGQGKETVPYDHLGEFDSLVIQMRQQGQNPNKINWVLYRYSYARVLLDNAIDNPDVTDLTDLKASWGGNMAVTLEGQAVYMMIFGLLLIIVSLVMLIYSIIALVKKKPFTRAKTAFIMLSLVMFLSFIFSFSFMRPDWTRIVAAVLLFIVIAAYSVIKHLMMDERDFSPTMFIHNAVLLLGAIVAFIILLLPMFKVTDVDSGKSVFYGYSFIYDLSVAQGAYSAVPMSYLLSVLLFMALVGLPAILGALLIISLMSRFITADYQQNEKRIFLIISTVVTVLVFLLIGLADKQISELYLNIKMVVPLMIIEPLIMAGLIAFEILFKVKPVKKELVIR